MSDSDKVGKCSGQVPCLSEISWVNLTLPESPLTGVFLLLTFITELMAQISLKLGAGMCFILLVCLAQTGAPGTEQDLLQEWKQRHLSPALESHHLPPLSLLSFEDERALQVRLNFIPKIKVRAERMCGMALA